MDQRPRLSRHVVDSYQSQAKCCYSVHKYEGQAIPRPTGGGGGQIRRMPDFLNRAQKRQQISTQNF